MMKSIVNVVLVCMLISGCSEKNKDVAILVNGQKVTNQQVNEAMETFRQNMINSMPEKALQPFKSEFRPMVARQIITNLLMLSDAKKRNIHIDSNQVNKAFLKLKKGYSNQIDFENELVSMGETESSIKKEMEKGVMLDSLLKIILIKIDAVSDEECKEFYLKNSSHYKSSPRFRVSQIFIPADSSKDLTKWQQSRIEAKRLWDKLKAGSKFEDVVSGYEKKRTDGDIGWFKTGDLKKELQNAIENRKIGEISELVKTNIGFHILKKTDEEAEKILPFDDVKESIQTMILIKKKTDHVNHYSDSLIKEANIIYLDSSLIMK